MHSARNNLWDFSSSFGVRSGWILKSTRGYLLKLNEHRGQSRGYRFGHPVWIGPLFYPFAYTSDRRWDRRMSIGVAVRNFFVRRRIEQSTPIEGKQFMAILKVRVFVQRAVVINF